ncbi:MAG: hypothetical protein ACXVPQ_09855 [Bacteroidia bacterium]
MLKNLKINTALFLCTAFVFRILFVNLGIISSLSTQQNGSTVKNQLASVMKRKQHTEASNPTRSCEYSVVEIYEEDADDDNQVKSNPFVLTQVLYSSVAGETGSNLKKITPARAYCSDTSSYRCLIQVFRI